VTLPDGRTNELKTRNAYAALAEAQIPIKVGIFSTSVRTSNKSKTKCGTPKAPLFMPLDVRDYM